MVDAKIDFYLDKIQVVIGEAVEQSLAATATQIKTEAKVNVVENDQVDTGFMLNAIYTVSGEGSSYGRAQGEARAQNPDGSMAPEARLDGASAAVVAGAEYSIFQEGAQSFLFRAAEQVGGSVAEATVERVGREVVKDG